MRKEDFQELRDRGWSLQRIADEYGLSRQRVSQILLGTKNIRKTIYWELIARSKGNCEWCGEFCNQSGKNVIYYLDQDRRNDTIENLALLCTDCYYKAVRMEKNHGQCMICGQNEYKLHKRIFGEVCGKCLDEGKYQIFCENHNVWSYKYDACVQCGRSDRPHQSHGLCGYCYSKKRYHEDPKRHYGYVKKWNKENPLQKALIDYVAYKKYREKNKDELNAKFREKYANDKEYRKRIKKAQDKYIKKNREKINARKRLRYATDPQHRIKQIEANGRYYEKRKLKKLNES